jgi:hypothetical protein
MKKQGYNARLDESLGEKDKGKKNEANDEVAAQGIRGDGKSGRKRKIQRQQKDEINYEKD